MCACTKNSDWIDVVHASANISIKTQNSDWIGWLVYTNIIAMWLVPTDDSVLIVCIVASIKLDLSILCWLLPKMAGSLL